MELDFFFCLFFPGWLRISESTRDMVVGTLVLTIAVMLLPEIRLKVIDHIVNIHALLCHPQGVAFGVICLLVCIRGICVLALRCGRRNLLSRFEPKFVAGLHRKDRSRWHCRLNTPSVNCKDLILVHVVN